MGRRINLENIKGSMEQTDEDRIYLGVGKFDIRIVHTDEGIVVDIFPYEEGVTQGDPIATTYAFDSEVDEG